MALRFCSFNVLAPSARICAPLNRRPWQEWLPLPLGGEERHAAICDCLLQLEADVICLQEFDFAAGTHGFAVLYQTPGFSEGKKLGEVYELHMKQRTGDKNEGLAMLIRRSAFKDIEVLCEELEPDFCDRVAMYAKLTHVDSGCRILVANTHLTVAHADNSHDIPFCRPRQMEQVLHRLLAAQCCDAVFLCADMNSDHLEREPSGPYPPEMVNRPVTMAFEQGFASALHARHPGVRPISHTCSYAQDGCADYVLFRGHSGLQLHEAFLHPNDLPLDVPWSSSTGWGDDAQATLSDHRPLVVDFSIAAAHNKL
ncbi:unnamed protein product [Cladocopium goreaui]|uniref:Endonuclease/exonuclease/phosphatase domain-containing protein n=1 Tax=Cladocopium goreaui TaxID=2562237 RepID=A0A9P1FJV3_9DINO|nr:unnamed protein product [Cladocopium goreaui]